MPLLELSSFISKLAIMAMEPTLKALSGSEAAIRARQQLGLPARPDKEDFGSLYRHALVEWGVFKPPPVLDFFRYEEVIEAIQRYNNDGDADALSRDMADLADWAAGSRFFEGLEIDPRSQLSGFLLAFDKALDDARSPGEARRDRWTAAEFDALQRRFDNLNAALALRPPPSDAPPGHPAPATLAAPEVMAELSAIKALLASRPAAGDIHLSGNFSGAIVNLLSTLTHVSQTTGQLATPLAPLDEDGRPPLPPAAHTTPPGSRLPYERNPLFTGREDDLRQLARYLLYEPAGAPAVVASGIGGVGKTQLAVEFAFRYGRYFHGVYWVSLAEGDPDAVARELAACGEMMGLWPPNDKETTPAEKARRTLDAWRQPTPRLIIFDNCEDPALLNRWRPKGGGARALVTSRGDRWPAGFAVQKVETLPRDRATALLRRLLAAGDRDAPTDAERDAVADAVADLPLALTLAGSYLAAFPTISIARYLGDLAAADPLPYIAPRPGADYSYTDHDLDVARTFAVSFDRLRPEEDGTDFLALRLLAGATCLVRGEPFPRALLTGMLATADDAHLGDLALNRLLALGLLERGGAGQLRLHRLLAVFVATTVARLDEDDEGIGIMAAARAVLEVSVMSLAAEQDVERDPRPLTGWLVHFRHVADAAYDREDKRAANLCHWLGNTLQVSGDLAGARPYLERALAIRERVLGPEHLDTVGSLNNLGYLLYEQGVLAEARKCFERVLTVWERVYGPEHLQTATALNNLAGVLKAQGNLAEAQVYFERALTISEHFLGPDDPQTASAVDNLGSLLIARGYLERAQPLYERALSIRKRVLGPEHPATALSLSNLGMLLQAQDDLDGARDHYKRALDIREKVLGPKHYDTAASLNNLGMLLQEQDELDKARPLLERALAIREEALGSNHLDTAASLNNLGLLLKAQRDLDGARDHYKRALAIREEVLGSNHLDTAASLNNLGTLLYAQKDLTEARPYLERALAIREEVLGSNHLDTAASLNNLGMLLQEQGDLDEAWPLIERALAIWEGVLGPEHSDTATAVSNLGMLLHKKGDLTKARPYYERALATSEDILGPGHPQTALAANNLAVLCYDEGNFAAAAGHMRRALAIQQKVLGPDHPDTQQSRDNLAAIEARLR